MTAEPGTTWGLGEYELMAERLAPVAAALVDLAGVSDRDRVVDLACGTGNAALIAAARGASVVGVDFEPRLLEIAAARASEQGSSVDWICDDATSPGLPEGAFSVALSAFGVMYVPDQEAAAAALARTCAPGARVALAAWTPGSLMPALGATLAAYLTPPPAGAPPPSRWGDRTAVTELLAGHAIAARAVRDGSTRLSFSDRPEAVRFLIRTAGHVLAEQPRLEREGRWQDLQRDLQQLVASRNEGHGAGVELRCDYLLVLADRRP
jgi:SAM-dependent methyltransferase